MDRRNSQSQKIEEKCRSQFKGRRRELGAHSEKPGKSYKKMGGKKDG